MKDFSAINEIYLADYECVNLSEMYFWDRIDRNFLKKLATLKDFVSRDTVFFIFQKFYSEKNLLLCFSHEKIVCKFSIIMNFNLNSF